MGRTEGQIAGVGRWMVESPGKWKGQREGERGMRGRKGGEEGEGDQRRRWSDGRNGGRDGSRRLDEGGEGVRKTGKETYKEEEEEQEEEEDMKEGLGGNTNPRSDEENNLTYSFEGDKEVEEEDKEKVEKTAETMHNK